MLRTLSRRMVSEDRRHVTGREGEREVREFRGGGGGVTPSRRNSDTFRSETTVGWLFGGVRPPSPPRHDTTAPEEPFCARGSIRLSLFLYFFIMNFLTRTCLSGSSLISLFLLGFRVGSSLFGIPFVEPFLL